MRVYRSLGVVDSGVALAEAFGAALGPEGARRVEELNAAAIEESRTDSDGFDPLISYPPDAWARADPDFWHPREPPR